MAFYGSCGASEAVDGHGGFFGRHHYEAFEDIFDSFIGVEKPLHYLYCNTYCTILLFIMGDLIGNADKKQALTKLAAYNL